MPDWRTWRIPSRPGARDDVRATIIAWPRAFFETNAQCGGTVARSTSTENGQPLGGALLFCSHHSHPDTLIHKRCTREKANWMFAPPHLLSRAIIIHCRWCRAKCTLIIPD
jgi:hypothetical protein